MILRLFKQAGISKILLIYYLILLAILLSWTNDTTFPPMPLRIVFLLALVFPLFFNTNNLNITPSIFILFTAVSLNSFAKSYMPGGEYYWVYIILIVLLYVRHKQTGIYMGAFYFLYLGLAITSLLTSTLYSEGILTITYTSFMIFLLAMYSKTNISQSVRFMSLAFSLVSFIFSVLFFLFADKYAIAYNQDFDRSGWCDPNYFGMIIGMGIVSSFIEIFNGIKDRSSKIFHYLNIPLSFIVVVVLASRGAVLSTIAAIGVMVTIADIKPRYKFLFLFLAGLFLLFLYSENYMDFLLFRIREDDGTGSGRTIIWANKINAFFSGNFLEQLFGYGRAGGLKLGSHEPTGFHNDYVAMLCEYGYVGFVAFIFTLLYPIIKSLRKYKNNAAVISTSVFMITCCYTLEPITAGNITFFFFMFYILMLYRNQNYVKASIR